MSMPEYFEAELWARGVDFGTFGRAEWKGLHPQHDDQLERGRLTLMLRAPKLRVYDIWAEVDGSWMQLNPVPGHHEQWENEDLVGVSVARLRLWVGPSWDTTLSPAPPRRMSGSGTPDASAGGTIGDAVGQGTSVEASYVPVVSGEPPLPEEREDVRVPSRVRAWLQETRDDFLVTAFLEEWTAACGGAAAHGWMVGLPRGEDLLETYARTIGLDRRVRDHQRGFARWLTTEVGRATRAGLVDRRELELRRPGARLIHKALQNLLRAVHEDLDITYVPPSIVGASNRHHWLVDEAMAARLDNPVTTPGSHRPMFVLRPRLRVIPASQTIDDGPAGIVVVEGEVV
jgi:hypothetical protein